ncbi:golgi uridine diphosphate-N-acetylglucosamine transporter [Elasticomyces elasticus]|nr:golgi uridine diphosphate-N-acetylglucosamine transporter [Elasticomyces elasticus]
MFYGINMLNNWAFAFDISVPVHIILRSFGSVTTMLAGWLRGRKYSQVQVLSVVLLTLGVLTSAWADAESKGKSMDADATASTSDFTAGLVILLVAQVLSAYMGVYVEDTYAEYSASWTENLFYSHFLSLPLFLPLSGTLRRQYARLASTSPLDLDLNSRKSSDNFFVPYAVQDSLVAPLQRISGTLPRGILFLLVNAMTQLLCISGVSVLSARASAVTVTIVLNIRKLVSFMFSTWIFGHELSGQMLLGAAMVFGSGALYGWETNWRLPRQKARQRDGEKEGSRSK